MAWYDTLTDNITSIFTDPEKQAPLPVKSLQTNAELIDAGGREGTGLNYGNLTQPSFPVDYSLPYNDTSNYGMNGLGPITINGGPENIIQGQNNGMTSAQKEALTSMGSYNAFNANQQIDPAAHLRQMA